MFVSYRPTPFSPGRARALVRFLSMLAALLALKSQNKSTMAALGNRSFLKITLRCSPPVVTMAVYEPHWFVLAGCSFGCRTLARGQRRGRRARFCEMGEGNRGV